MLMMLLDELKWSKDSYVLQSGWWRLSRRTEWGTTWGCWKQTIWTSFQTPRRSIVPSASPPCSQERVSCSESAYTPSAGPLHLAVNTRHPNLSYTCSPVHIFRECLKGTIVNSQNAEVSCPDECESKLLDREIQAVSIKKTKQNEASDLKNGWLERNNRLDVRVAGDVMLLIICGYSCWQKKSTSGFWSCVWASRKAALSTAFIVRRPTVGDGASTRMKSTSSTVNSVTESAAFSAG